jgi:hypothetical protein
MAVRPGKAAVAETREHNNSVPQAPAAAGPAPVAAMCDPKNRQTVDRPGVCAEVCGGSTRGVDRADGGRGDCENEGAARSVPDKR